MLETLKQIALSQHQWSAFVYLVVGAIAGAFISIQYSFKAQRPKLLISGGGSGGNQKQHSWTIVISNRPSFFGQNIDGESARDVSATLRLKEKNSQSYQLFWDGQQKDTRTTIEPGEQKHLRLFQWREGSSGYTIVDRDEEPVARFQSRESVFVLALSDKLGRRSEYLLTVQFDDSHLKNTPRLQIVPPVSIRTRKMLAKNGLRMFFSAFRPKGRA